MKENHVVTCFVENDGSMLIVKRSSGLGHTSKGGQE
jgi:hypothetical protein